MTSYAEKSKSILMSSLSYSEYYHLNGNTVETRVVTAFERIWRCIGTFFGLCESTAAKCHRVSLEQLQKLSSISSPASFFHSNPKKNETLAIYVDDLWIGTQIEKYFESRKENLINEIGWGKFLSWVERHQAHSLLEALNLKTPIAPLAQSTIPCVDINGTHLTPRSLLNQEHAKLSEKLISQIVSFLSDNRFKDLAKGKPLTLDYQLNEQPLRWPFDENLSKIASTFKLHFTGINSVEIDLSQVQQGQITQLVSWLLSQKNVKTVRFINAQEKGSVLPLDIARSLISMKTLERLDLGSFAWPLPLTALPAIWNTSSSTMRSASINKSPFPLSWKKIQQIQPYCPSIELKSNQSFFIPEGVLKRISGHFYDFLNPKTSAAHFTCIHNQDASLIYTLFEASLAGFDDSFEGDFSNLVDVAIRYQMPYALASLARAYRGFAYVRTDKLRAQPLPSNQDTLTDLSLLFNHKTLDIDLYQLAQLRPTRAKCLSHYPRHQSFAIEHDPQIKHADLQTYFEGKACLLNRENLTSFWAIAISFNDDDLFSNIESWLKNQHLGLYPEYQLETWLNLAVSSETCPNLQHLIQSAMQLQAFNSSLLNRSSLALF